MLSMPAAITSKRPQPLMSPGDIYTVLSATRLICQSSLVVHLDVPSGCYQRMVNEFNSSEQAENSPDCQLCPGELIAPKELRYKLSFWRDWIFASVPARLKPLDH